jgi:Lrp/AsnC family transcriptional regulator for asnA, asnC and gidA
MYKDAVEHLRSIAEVVECSFTTGPYSILVKMYAHDNEQLMDLLNNKIQSIPGVVSTETMIVLDSSIKRNLPME